MSIINYYAHNYYTQYYNNIVVLHHVDTVTKSDCLYFVYNYAMACVFIIILVTSYSNYKCMVLLHAKKLTGQIHDSLINRVISNCSSRKGTEQCNNNFNAFL